MPKLTWDNPGDRVYEAGVERGVLYVGNKPGVAWNGLISIDESTDGAEEQTYYIDGVKYLNLLSNEDFRATISAYTYPDEFAECDGSLEIYQGLFATAQRRMPFGLTYQTKVGNDLDGIDHGYKIHLVYNALAKPSNRSNSSLGENIDPSNFTWDISTLAPEITGYKRTAHFVVDSRSTYPDALSTLENALYGSNSDTPHLPSVSELLTIFAAHSDFVLVDNGDGTWTATGSDDYIQMTDLTTFEITWPQAVYIDDDTYTISTP